MIGLMTRAVRVSDDMVNIPESLVKTVADVIAVAWRQLLTEHGHEEFCSFVEDQITERLYMVLGEIEGQPVEELRDLALLQSPVRDGKVRNYNNKHPDKMPDLAYRPAKGSLGNVGNTATAALFIECKPIDQTRPVGSTYCKKGLIRFVNGDYSWRVNKAMMIGYVRNISKLPASLQKVLADPAMGNQLGYSGELQQEYNTIKGDSIWSSYHSRSFQINNADVDDIKVVHLWLYPNKPCEECASRGG